MLEIVYNKLGPLTVVLCLYCVYTILKSSQFDFALVNYVQFHRVGQLELSAQPEVYTNVKQTLLQS